MFNYLKDQVFLVRKDPVSHWQEWESLALSYSLWESKDLGFPWLTAFFSHPAFRNLRLLKGSTSPLSPGRADRQPHN